MAAQEGGPMSNPEVTHAERWDLELTGGSTHGALFSGDLSYVLDVFFRAKSEGVGQADGSYAPLEQATFTWKPPS